MAEREPNKSAGSQEDAEARELTSHGKPVETPDEAAVTDATEKFDQLPPQMKKTVLEMTSMFMASGPMPHPLVQKMSTEHIGKVIDNIENESQRAHADRTSARHFSFAALVVVLVFVLLLSVGCFWRDKLEYIAPIITALIGGAGGYGIGLSHGRRRE